MDSNSATDAELVTESLSGRREAFGTLYDRYARAAASVVAGVSGDWGTVDDMVQESFLRAFRKLPTLRARERFGPWIIGIARQVGRERRRSMRRDRHEFCDSIALATNDRAEESATISMRDDFTDVMRLVAALDEPERIAIHAYFLQQQNANETAAQLGLSRSGFYATVHRALGRLAKQFAPTDRERVNQ